ncbi:putative neck protein [Klebsiella phage SBP]|uniref:Neck protein n=1 Tax=Klebsiella phage SBP TaxID=2973661 RepID=A0A9X9P1T2_9CAUD|nr:tail completion or Neck1 protein [Klebsiella phage SBP]UYE94753.1 putative neck protein [Klebsiella phage SBP]
MSVNIKALQQAKLVIAKKLEEFETMNSMMVTVGIHEDQNSSVGDGEMTMARLGATLNYGAEIDHPGGTRYTKTADGKARFISNDSTAPAMGITGPHKIIIPARPWLEPGVASAEQDISDTFKDAFVKDLPVKQVLEQMGSLAVGAVQQYMTDLKEPPNAKSTIKQKGSSNPLIDTGALRASVTYKVSNEKPDEGIL